MSEAAEIKKEVPDVSLKRSYSQRSDAIVSGSNEDAEEQEIKSSYQRQKRAMDKMRHKFLDSKREVKKLSKYLAKEWEEYKNEKEQKEKAIGELKDLKSEGKTLFKEFEQARKELHQYKCKKHGMVERADHEALELELSDEKQKYRNMEKQKGLMEGLCAKQQSYIEELREMLKKRGLKHQC